jgi:hypothetical protein
MARRRRVRAPPAENRPGGRGGDFRGRYAVISAGIQTSAGGMRYTTVAAKAGDTSELTSVGFGPTTPALTAGAALPSGVYGTATNTIQLVIDGQTLTPASTSITGAGVYQSPEVRPSWGPAAWAVSSGTKKAMRLPA